MIFSVRTTNLFSLQLQIFHHSPHIACFLDEDRLTFNSSHGINYAQAKMLTLHPSEKSNLRACLGVQEPHRAIVGALVSLAQGDLSFGPDVDLPECDESDKSGEIGAGGSFSAGGSEGGNGFAPARFAAEDRIPAPAAPAAASSPGGGVGALPEAPRAFAGYEMYESIGMGKFGEARAPSVPLCCSLLCR